MENFSVSPTRPAFEGSPPALLHKILANLLLVPPGCTLLTVPNKRQRLSATITLPAFAPPEKVNVLLKEQLSPKVSFVLAQFMELRDKAIGSFETFRS
jgi:hypothetical protein